jgi:hypothetical protein
MPSSLPIFTPVAAIAILAAIAQIDGRQRELLPANPPVLTQGQPGTPQTPQIAKDAKALIDRAIFNLESRHSISAEISHEIDLFGQQIRGNGHYYEERSGPRPRIRLELKIPFGEKLGALDIPAAEQTGSLVRVCDGRYLWTYRRLLDHEKLAQVDLDRVEKTIEETKKSPNEGGLDGLAGAGGLSRLLRGLDASFRFEVLGETTLHGTPVVKLRGQWRPERLVRLLPAQKAAIEQGRAVDLDALPAHLPDSVLLFLGTQDLFPHRFEYRRSRPKDAQGAGDEDADPDRAIVTMTLLKVSVNLPIDPACFDYRPGDIKPIDETEQYLQTLGL